MATLEELTREAEKNIQDRERILKELFRLAHKAKDLASMRPLVHSVIKLMKHCPVCETWDRVLEKHRGA